MLDRNLLAPNAVRLWAERTPDAVAIDHVNAGQTLTYAELLEGSYRFASALVDQGVAPGAHIASMLPNIFDAHRTMLGLGWVGAIEVPLNTAYVGAILRHALTLSEATMLITTTALLPQTLAVIDDVPALRTILLVDGAAPDEAPAGVAILDLRPVLAATTVRTDFVGPEVSTISSLLFTSGTTGPSKAVVTPWGLTFQMWSWVPDGTLLAGEGLFTAMPLFHNSGRSGFNFAMGRGARLVTRDKFSATNVWDDVRSHDCQVLALVGPLTALLYSAEPREDDRDHPVRHVIIGPMIPQIEDFEQRFGVTTCVCYGQTEIGAPLGSDWDHGPWETCGKPRTTWPFTECRIVDPMDEAVELGEVGELVVRTEQPWALNQGYYGMPEKTVEAWRNGWFHTGDAFRADADGHYYFVDRMTDTLRRRGENISSFEVETAVQEHPAVKECTAIGIRDDRGDDEVMVSVIVSDPAFSPAELLEFLTPRMPRFMLPRYVDVVEDFPRNATTGRVRKTELRATGVPPTAWDREAAG